MRDQSDGPQKRAAPHLGTRGYFGRGLVRRGRSLSGVEITSMALPARRSRDLNNPSGLDLAPPRSLLITRAHAMGSWP